VACALAATAFGGRAEAQTQTPTLDRLVVWGAPDDGIGIMRPVTNDKPIFFAQFALGYSLNPLHVNDLTSGNIPLNSGASSIVMQGQFTEYLTAGFEFLDRFTLALSLPITEEYGNTPDYAAGTGIGTGSSSDPVNTSGATAGDTRLDLRGVAWRTRDRRGAIGGGLSLLFPTGGQFLWGGEGTTTALLMVTGEYTFHIIRDINLIAVLNTGFDLRPSHSINDPSGNAGLGVHNEWRWAAAAYVPLKQDKYRLGLAIYGQTGLDNIPSSGAGDIEVGNTIFRGSNTPLEWQAEFRMRFAKLDRFWAGIGAGSRLDEAYGAPDFRAVLLAGFYVPIVDSDANSPEAKLATHKKFHDLHLLDTDHDGIPDDIDACPTEPEDHLGNDPSDGCPQPPDRDGDGVPDQFDKCPDVAAPTADGCPLDTDKDGIPDTLDACPKEPGPPNADPKKNGCPQFIKLEGSVVRILQQVHFATASTTILPDSFPMLQEIANLLKANPSIHRMSIDGHTDNRGAADMNMTLSQGRATSVMTWLNQHGIEGGRLEAHGYGLTKPIADNETDAGRLTNRRVEFKILDEGTPKGPAKPTPPPAPPPGPPPTH
jgi:outer membrane protein OmpA-like peptidoglycan-associated protein